MNVKIKIVLVTAAAIVCASVTVIWFKRALDFLDKTASVTTVVSSLTIILSVYGEGKNWEQKKQFKFFLSFCTAYAGLSAIIWANALFTWGNKGGIDLLVSLLLKILALGTSGYLLWISYRMRRTIISRTTSCTDNAMKPFLPV